MALLAALEARASLAALRNLLLADTRDLAAARLSARRVAAPSAAPLSELLAHGSEHLLLPRRRAARLVLHVVQVHRVRVTRRHDRAAVGHGQPQVVAGVQARGSIDGGAQVRRRLRETVHLACAARVAGRAGR